MTPEQRREAMQPAHRALSNLREGMTTEQRREATQHLHSEEVQAKRMESLAEYQSGRTAEERREATQHLHSEEVQAKRLERHRTFEEQVKSLAAYKAQYRDCHVPGTFKDDKVLANWVWRVRHGLIILSEMQKQILDEMGFAWDIDEINESKRQHMILEVCLIVTLLSLSYNFTNNLSYTGE